MISFQSEPGVILSKRMKARMNSRTPITAKRTAASALWSIDIKGSAISLASHVVACAEKVIVRPVRARVVSDGAWNVLHFGGAHRGPPAHLDRDHEQQCDDTDGGVDGMLHQPSSLEESS